MEIGNRKERVRDYASFPDESPSGGFGRQPNVTPVLPKIAKRINARIRERSVPDSVKAALNRREAKMGFGDEIPKRGLGRQSQRNPHPQRKT